jgi:plasmid maintenance system killer protein
VGVQYFLRIAALEAMPNVQELYRSRSFDLHPSAGNRAGQHAVRLTGQVRLIMAIEDGETIKIEEVVDYHG